MGINFIFLGIFNFEDEMFFMLLEKLNSQECSIIMFSNIMEQIIHTVKDRSHEWRNIRTL